MSGRGATLVLLRHGESTWNRENRFTGWTDVPLTEAGREQAGRAGDRLREAGVVPRTAHTSLLERAARTLEVARERGGWRTLEIRRAWELNERHYGALQGRNKAESEAEFGAEQVRAWRRSFTARPPLVPADDPRNPRFDPRYRGVPADRLPRGESLEDTARRVLPYWEQAIVPDIAAGPVLIVAHGNSLRALVMHLEGLAPADIRRRNVPTGIPLVYRLDAERRVLDWRYLAPREELDAAVRAASIRP